MASKGRRKNRPTYSCLNCHKRKVKVCFPTAVLIATPIHSDIQCDRVKPCGACCLRGDPSGCEYSFTGQDRQYIEQNALIDHLWRSCETLKKQLAEARVIINQPANKAQAPSSSPRRKKRDIAAIENEEKQSTDKLSSIVHSSPLLKENNLLATPASANKLVDVFMERLVDEFSPGSAAARSGSVMGWRTAAEMRVFSPLLGRAFTAAALTLAGYREGNRSIQVAGQARYVRTLRSLQDALYHPTESRSTAVLIVVVLFTIIEVRVDVPK